MRKIQVYSERKVNEQKLFFDLLKERQKMRSYIHYEYRPR